MRLNSVLKISAAALVAGSLLVGCSSGSSSSNSSSSDATWNAIKKAGTINFGTEGIYSPFSYHDSKTKKLVGYDVDVARAVAKKLGLKAKFTEIKWDGLIAGLDAKKLDVVANQVSITPERKAKYVFSKPYTYSYGSLIVRSSNKNIHSFKDLKGKKAAQSKTSNWTAVSKKYGAKLTYTDGFTQDIQLLQQGRVDATVNDNVTFLDYKKQKPNAKIKIAATSKEETQSAFLARKGSTETIKQLNKALTALAKDGTLTKISEKYFNEDVSQAKK